jgi:TonB family protein
MRRLFSNVGLFLILVSSAFAQTAQRVTRLAILDLGATSIGKLVAEKIRANFRSTEHIQLLDPDLSATAARGIGYTGSLNMSVSEARDLGAAIDAEFYLIGDAQTLRRTSSKTPVYYESYSSIFVISSRTGRLVFWDRLSAESDSVGSAEQKLTNLVAAKEPTVRALAAIRKAQTDESNQRLIDLASTAPLIEEAPEDDKIASTQGLRLPKPYRRLRPTYPESAARAEVEATVDVLVDVGADGEVGQIQVARWAGFGLDETTVATVRQLHFFPAMRDGAPIPMRVLLRYNFRKPSQ